MARHEGTEGNELNPKSVDADDYVNAPEVREDGEPISAQVSHDDLSDVSPNDHHEPVTSHDQLDDVSPADHHERYTGDEAFDDLQIRATNTGGTNYEIQINGSDGAGIINFKTE